jgi:hypothetical protein
MFNKKIQVSEFKSFMKNNKNEAEEQLKGMNWDST